MFIILLSTSFHSELVLTVIYHSYYYCCCCCYFVIIIVSRGVPAVVDFAAMRDAISKLGGDPSKINPVCPADLVIDHSVQVSSCVNYRNLIEAVKIVCDSFYCYHLIG